MAIQKPSTKKRDPQASDRQSRGGEQIALALVMWLVPLGLFSYVGIQVALATGQEVPEWLQDFDFRRAAILLAVGFLVLASTLVLVPIIAPRKSRRAGPWDNKTSPGQLPGK